MIDDLCKKLKKRVIPLPIDKCWALADWLKKWADEHDNKLIRDVFLQVEKKDKKVI